MQTHTVRNTLLVLLIIVLAAAAVVYLYRQSASNIVPEPEASGTVEVVEIKLAPELGGRVLEVLVDEGDSVEAGAPLLKLDASTWTAQRRQAEAALATAQASLGLAHAALDSAKSAQAAAQAGITTANVQYEIELAASRQQDQPLRASAWTQTVPEAFEQPVWYFQKSEQIAAAHFECDRLKKMLDDEITNLDAVLKRASSADFIAAETRLANAQAAYRVAQAVLNRAEQQDDANLLEQAQTNFDSAEAELDGAQNAYQQILSTQAAEDVTEARARAAVARATYDTADDDYRLLLTGDESLRVRAAQAGVDRALAAAGQAETGVAQAQAGVTQAEKAVAQAQASLDLIDTQIAKLTLTAPAAGVVLTRDIQPGEMAQPGAIILTIGQLDRQTITVYVNEDRYGKLRLGDHVQIKVDSFPGEIFDGTISAIADQAEYTPRNVQTEEGRRTTVFAVKLNVTAPSGKLKPGMPATVIFSNP